MSRIFCASHIPQLSKSQMSTSSSKLFCLYFSNYRRSRVQHIIFHCSPNILLTKSAGSINNMVKRKSEQPSSRAE